MPRRSRVSMLLSAYILFTTMPLAAFSTMRASAAVGTVRVLYAGSLVNLMENDLGPAFAKTSGITVQGRAGGSVALAHMILDGVRVPDVFVSADPAVNTLLLHAPPGRSAPWFFTLARTTMVLAYSPRSRFVAAFRDATAGLLPWYEVLGSPGLQTSPSYPVSPPRFWPS